MKLCTFEYENRREVGIVRGDRILPVSEVNASAGTKVPEEMLRLIQAGCIEELKEVAGGVDEGADASLPAGDVRLCLPYERPPKIWCIGLNYQSHAEDIGADIKIPSYPVEEYLGLIFVYMGEGAPPPFPGYPDVEAPVITVDTKFRDSSWYNHLALDRAHVNFTHFHRAADSKGRPTVPPAEETDWGLTYAYEAGSKMDHTTHFGMPGITAEMTFTRPGRRVGSSLRWRVPVDDDTHRDFTVNGFDSEEQRDERARDVHSTSRSNTGYDDSTQGNSKETFAV